MAINQYVQDGKTYYEVYIGGFDSGGRRFQRRKKGIVTRRQAETLEFKMKCELTQRKEGPVAYNWSDWFAECMRRIKVTQMPSTVSNYQARMDKWINHRWAERDLEDISRMDVHNVIYEGLGDKVSEHSRKTILKMVRRIFSMAVEEGLLDKNPCAGVQVRVAEVEQEVLTTAEAELLLREGRAVNHRFYPMWVMALMTGMRSGELYALRWSDIDLDARIISVSRSWSSKNGFCPTKTQKSRVVPISDALLKFLKEWKLQRAGEEFVLPQIREWQRGEQANVTREFCIMLGITPIKFHDLRATFITNLLSRGEPVARVMAIVGHNQIKTTDAYLRKAGIDLATGYRMLRRRKSSGSRPQAN